MQFRQDLIDAVAELHEAARVETKRIREQAESATASELVWQRCRDYLSKGWFLHFLTLAETEAPRFKELRAAGHPAVEQLEEAYREAKEEAGRLMRRFPAVFDAACRAAGLSLDPVSRHPKYSIDEGFFRLDVDEQKRLGRLSNHEGRLAELPADPDALVETIQRERHRVLDRPYNGQRFLKMVRAQYKAVLKKGNLVDGASVPIRHITRRLGKNAKGFRTDEFLVDLSRLAERGPLEIEGRRLDLQQTKDTSQGMLLHGAAGRGYVGFVVFKEV